MSISVRMKHRYASCGVQTIGSPRTLKEVLTMTGHPVLFLAAHRDSDIRLAFHDAEKIGHEVFTDRVIVVQGNEVITSGCLYELIVMRRDGHGCRILPKPIRLCITFVPFIPLSDTSNSMCG
jgi:hypothetical protein